jgi:hypothetical protein
VGEIPEGMIVTRTCGNNKCINSDHLTLTTRGDLNKKSQYHPIEYEIDENGCHVCTSHPSGVIRINGKSEYIRRVIYREHFGEIGEDKYIYQVLVVAIFVHLTKAKIWMEKGLTFISMFT